MSKDSTHQQLPEFVTYRSHDGGKRWPLKQCDLALNRVARAVKPKKLCVVGSVTTRAEVDMSAIWVLGVDLEHSCRVAWLVSFHH